MGHVFRFPHTPTRWRPHRRLRLSHLLFALLALAVLALAARVIPSHTPPSPRASATAIDGDTLRMGQQLIRLQGIDAPEFEQHCQDEQGRAWPCGREAQAGLAQLIGHSLISCTINGSDRYGRALATCSNDRVGDVGQAMVRAGLAVNFLGWRYQLAQLQARAQKRGVWRGTFETPQDWRRKRRTADR
jgi:endonuclease YncB( thermonuclease family)